MVWHSQWVFSIRSAYHVSHKQLSKFNVRECSNNTRMKSLQKSIWKFHCPNKIRNFIWRACKDILPTKTKLRDREIPVEVECDLCGGVETAGHTFWGCDFVAAVWQMANVKAPGLMTNPSNFLDLFWCIMEAKPNQDLEASATTAWFFGTTEMQRDMGKAVELPCRFLRLQDFTWQSSKPTVILLKPINPTPLIYGGHLHQVGTRQTLMVLFSRSEISVGLER